MKTWGGGVFVLALLWPAFAAAAPEWFSTRKAAAFPASSHLVGVAACGAEVADHDRATCAIQHAVEDIALQLRSQVDVERKHTSETTVESSTSAEGKKRKDSRKYARSESTGTVSSSLQLDGIKPAYSECDAKQKVCYSLVALERRATAQRWLKRHESYAIRVETLLKEVNGAAPPRQLTLLMQARNLAKQQDELAELIPAVDANVAAPPLVFPALEARTHKLLSTFSVGFSVEGTSESDLLFSQARKRLADMHMRLLQTSSPSRPDEGTFHIRARVSTAPPRTLFGTNTVIDVQVEVTVTSGGEVLGTSPSLGDRGVKRGADAALDAALDHLSPKVADYVQTVLLKE